VRNCYGGINGLAEDGTYWARFFTAASNTKSRALRQMDVLPIDLPFRCSMIDADSEPCRQTRSILEQDKWRRLFAYATMDDKYAM
jgi:hypothetical protein